LNPEDFMRLAERVLANKYAGPEGYKLVRRQGDWYRYKHGIYEQVGDNELIRSVVWHYLHQQLKPARPTQANPNPPPVPFNPGPKHVTGTLDAMGGQTVVNAEIVPAWIRGWSGPSSEGLVVMKNGIFHVGTKQVWPHTQGLFAVNQIPFDYEAGATCPQWLKFLDDAFPGDRDAVDAIQEWFGYMLTSDTSLQKILCFIGPRRSGKGTIGRVLRAMLGDTNVAGPTMAMLAQQFGLAPLLDKMVAIISDARATGRDAQIIAERLLMISGEDAVTVDRKNKEAVTLQMPLRFVIMSNEMPSLGDSSSALVGRMVFIKMSQTFYGREDSSLTKRLLAELPGVFNWALEGLARLKQRGKFLQPDSGEELAHEMEELNNPMKGFVERCCVLGEGEKVRKDYLFAAWKGYCRKHERHPGTREVFSKMLLSAVSSVKTSRSRDEGDRIQSYVGITLTERLTEKIATETFKNDDEDY
jgi:P4 family phage/plasmid primase-like protien